MKYALTSALLSSFLLPVLPRLSTTLAAQECDVFGEAVNLQGLELAGGTWILRSSLTEDGLTLYYDVWSGASALELFIMEARRESTADEFQGGRRLDPELNQTGVRISDPAISPDGLTLYYTYYPPQGVPDIWVAIKDDPDDVQFVQVMPLSDTINTGAPEVAGCESYDGEELFFVRDFNLWVAEFVEPGDPLEGFRDEREIKAVNSESNLFAPSVSAEGSYLLWSDWPQDFVLGGPPRPGGHGSADIWIAARERILDGGWGAFGEPVNLPEPANSGSHEGAPWLTVDGKEILFASTRFGFGQTLYKVPVLEDLCALFDSDCCRDARELFIRGDADGDGDVDPADAINTIGALFLGQGAITCQDSSDSNDDKRVDIADAINTLNVLFLGMGQIPPPGMTNCGHDPTPDALGCDRDECRGSPGKPSP